MMQYSPVQYSAVADLPPPLSRDGERGELDTQHFHCLDGQDTKFTGANNGSLPRLRFKGN